MKRAPQSSHHPPSNSVCAPWLLQLHVGWPAVILRGRQCTQCPPCRLKEAERAFVVAQDTRTAQLGLEHEHTAEAITWVGGKQPELVSISLFKC